MMKKGRKRVTVRKRGGIGMRRGEGDMEKRQGGRERGKEREGKNG